MKNGVRDAERGAFLNSLPATLGQMRALFDLLDKDLGNVACDHSDALIRKSCGILGLPHDLIVEWASGRGAYCDCEFLANLEDPLEDAAKAMK